MDRDILIRSCVDLIQYVEGIEDREIISNVLKDKSWEELLEELEFYTEVSYK